MIENKNIKKCSICEKKHYAKGLCKFHYDRKRKNIPLDMKKIIRTNEYKVSGDIATFYYYNKSHEIAGSFIVDTFNIDKVLKYKWSVLNNGYIVAYSSEKIILLHRYLTNCDDFHVVDHKNRNKKDNRMSNLRVCTPKVNAYNSDKKRGITGEFGITKTKFGYTVQIDGKYIGHYKELDKAKEIRDEALITSKHNKYYYKEIE